MEPPHYAQLKPWILASYPSLGMTGSKQGPASLKIFTNRLAKAGSKPKNVDKEAIRAVVNHMMAYGLT